MKADNGIHSKNTSIPCKSVSPELRCCRQCLLVLCGICVRGVMCVCRVFTAAVKSHDATWTRTCNHSLCIWFWIYFLPLNIQKPFTTAFLFFTTPTWWGCDQQSKKLSPGVKMNLSHILPRCPEVQKEYMHAYMLAKSRRDTCMHACLPLCIPVGLLCSSPRSTVLFLRAQIWSPGTHCQQTLPWENLIPYYRLTSICGQVRFH